MGAGALRSGEERAPRIDSHETPASCPDLRDVDGRNAHVITAALQEPRPEVDPGPDIQVPDPVVPAAFDHRRLGRGTTHVEGEDVLVAEDPAAISAAPTTPADGPDSMMLTGRAAAASTPIAPPFDCMIRKRPGHLQATKNPFEGLGDRCRRRAGCRH